MGPLELIHRMPYCRSQYLRRSLKTKAEYGLRQQLPSLLRGPKGVGGFVRKPYTITSILWISPGNLGEVVRLAWAGHLGVTASNYPCNLDGLEQFRPNG